jgi:3-oxoacyl-[acyl-carrier protein] reductase
MDLGIGGKVAIVTGGSSGIGRACAVELAREGVRVCFVGRDLARLEETRVLTAKAGAEGFAVQVDLSTAEGCKTVVDACVESFGGVDILVNNAGSAQPAPVLDMPIETVQSAFELKLYGYIRMSQLVIPHMRRKGWGRIVMVAGAAGTSPAAENLPASFANIGILNLTRSLTDEVAGDDILVNAVCPGGVNTPRAHSRYQRRADAEGKSMEQVVEEAGRELPAGRIAEPEDIARVVAFLASEPCSYVYASAIYMDGGFRRATP